MGKLKSKDEAFMVSFGIGSGQTQLRGRGEYSAISNSRIPLQAAMNCYSGTGEEGVDRQQGLPAVINASLNLAYRRGAAHIERSDGRIAVII